MKFTFAIAVVAALALTHATVAMPVDTTYAKAASETVPAPVVPAEAVPAVDTSAGTSTSYQPLKNAAGTAADSTIPSNYSVPINSTSSEPAHSTRPCNETVTATGTSADGTSVNQIVPAASDNSTITSDNIVDAPVDPITTCTSTSVILGVDCTANTTDYTIACAADAPAISGVDCAAVTTNYTLACASNSTLFTGANCTAATTNSTIDSPAANTTAVCTADSADCTGTSSADTNPSTESYNQKAYGSGAMASVAGQYGITLMVVIASAGMVMI